MNRPYLVHPPVIACLLLAISASLGPLPLVAQQSSNGGAKASIEAAPSQIREPANANSPASSAATPVGQDAGTAKQQAIRASKTAQEETEQEDKKPKPKDDEKLKGHSIEAVVIAGLLIALLGLMFVLQLSFSRKLDQTTYLGGVFRDSVLAFEKSRLSAQLRDDWEKHVYYQKAVFQTPPPKPDEKLEQLDREYGFGELRDSRDTAMNQLLGLIRKEGGTVNPYRMSPPPGLPGNRDNREPGGFIPRPHPDPTGPTQIEQEDPNKCEYDKLARIFKNSLNEWQDQIKRDAREAYDNDLKQAEQKAEQNTKYAIDTTDVALLRGLGPKFVLEFTALIVIIFMAVILGVLGRLDAQQIGTLLAAIAGYVLGKAATSQGSVTTTERDQRQRLAGHP